MPELSNLQKRILTVFMRAGVNKPLTLEMLRQKVRIQPNEQSDLPRRIRELRAKGYDIGYDSSTKAYRLRAEKPARVKTVDDGKVSGTLRARVLHVANSRCGMCGKHTQEDGIRLVIDHRVPYSWGGATIEENLWAICEVCNIQKKNFFATLDPALMKRCMAFSETQKRLGELLKAYGGEIVPRSLLEVVGRDDEWTRRLRELRSLGWKVERIIDPSQTGRYMHTYRLIESKPWPDSISAALKGRKQSRKSLRRDW